MDFQGKQWFILFSALHVLISLSAYFLPNAEQFFALVVANTLISNNYIWNLITSCFFELSLSRIVLNLTVLFFVHNDISGHPFDQMILYLIFNILFSNICVTFLSFFRYFSLGIDRPLLHSTYGFSGILISFLMFSRVNRGSSPVAEVIFKDKPVPEALKFITFNNLPVIILGIQLLLKIIGLGSFVVDTPYTFFSIIFSWSYVRFYFPFNSPSGSAVGFHNEEFEFIRMFPKSFYVILIPFTTAFYNCMSVIGVFPPLSVLPRYHHLRNDSSYTTSSSSSAPLLSSKPANGSNTKVEEPAPIVDPVNERRKLKAIKLLDARLAEIGESTEVKNV